MGQLYLIQNWVRWIANRLEYEWRCKSPLAKVAKSLETKQTTLILVIDSYSHLALEIIVRTEFI